jgi:hypothetical protein
MPVKLTIVPRYGTASDGATGPAFAGRARVFVDFSKLGVLWFRVVFEPLSTHLNFLKTTIPSMQWAFFATYIYIHTPTTLNYQSCCFVFCHNLPLKSRLNELSNPNAGLYQLLKLGL